MTSTNNNNNNKQNIYPKSCNMDVIHRFIRITQLMKLRSIHKEETPCPNGTNKPVTNTITTKPTYYHKKLGYPSLKMSNSLQLLTGPITDIQKKYEILSAIVTVEYGAKVNGSQRDKDPKTGIIDLLYIMKFLKARGK